MISTKIQLGQIVQIFKIDIFDLISGQVQRSETRVSTTKTSKNKLFRGFCPLLEENLKKGDDKFDFPSLRGHPTWDWSASRGP